MAGGREGKGDYYLSWNARDAASEETEHAGQDQRGGTETRMNCECRSCAGLRPASWWGGARVDKTAQKLYPRLHNWSRPPHRAKRGTTVTYTKCSSTFAIRPRVPRVSAPPC